MRKYKLKRIKARRMTIRRVNKISTSWFLSGICMMLTAILSTLNKEFFPIIIVESVASIIFFYNSYYFSVGYKKIR